MTLRPMIGGVLLLLGSLSCAPIGCFAHEPTAASNDREHQSIPRILLEPAVDDARVQVELSKAGGALADRGQLVSKGNLLKQHAIGPLALPKPSRATRDDARLAARCRAAVVVVARMARTGPSKDWVALPATGFFISTSGIFITSSHVIHGQDYEGMVVMAGDGRVLPVRSVLADDQQCDVAILKADGGPVAALPLEASSETGARVAVMSHPVGRFFTFAQGCVTRRSFQREGSRLQEMLEISAEFGPGSSGAPVVNSRGNVIGWVDAVQTWPNPALPATSSHPTLTFRECGVSADLLRLVKQLQDNRSRTARTASRLPELDKGRNAVRPSPEK